MRRLYLAATLIAPALAFAAGGDTSTPPKPTQTTKDCTGGQVWDPKSQTCKDPSHHGFDDDALYQAVREFSYSGQYLAAQAALAAMSDQADDRVLAYWGFTHRKLGDAATGMRFYRAALRRNPGNILARSYMGQALVEAGDPAGARAELLQIRAHGGKGSWAEAALESAMATGAGYSY